MSAAARSASSVGVAGPLLFASGVLAAIGIAFLIAMFVSFAAGATAAGQAFGRVNDILIMVAYPLAIPGILGLRALLRPHAPVGSAIAASIGIVAIGAIVVLQALLVGERLTFEEQVGPVTLALFALGASLVTTGYLGRASGALSDGLRMGLIGATYFGYPIWAVWARRRLLSSTRAVRVQIREE